MAGEHEKELRKCVDEACKAVPDYCDQDANQMTNEQKHMCKMCFPEPNDSMIAQHCKSSVHSEYIALYTLCGLFFTIILLTLCVCSGKRVRRSRERKANSMNKSQALAIVPMKRELYLPNMIDIPEEDIAQMEIDSGKPWYSRWLSKSSHLTRSRPSVPEKSPPPYEVDHQKRWYRAMLSKSRRPPTQSAAEHGLSPTKVRTKAPVPSPEPVAPCGPSGPNDPRPSTASNAPSGRAPLEPIHPNGSGSFKDRRSFEDRTAATDGASIHDHSGSFPRRGWVDRGYGENGSFANVDRVTSATHPPRGESGRVSMSESLTTLDRAAMARRNSRVASSGVDNAVAADASRRNVPGSGENVRSP